MKLYWNLASQPARAVKALLDIGKIQAELVTVDIMRNETRTKQYLTMNPFGQIPFLVDGKTSIAESNAILVYLCQRYSESIPVTIYGQTAEKRAIVNQHLSWYQNYFRPALFRIIYLKVYQCIKKGVPIYSSQLAAAQKEIIQALKLFEQLLSKEGGKYIAGMNLTIADLQFFFEMTNLMLYQIEFTEYKHVDQWFRQVYAVPQVKAITHQWYALVPKLKQTLDSVKATNTPKL